MPRCSCGAEYTREEAHYRFSPHCRPPPPPPPTKKRDRTASQNLFKQRVIALLVHEMLKAHFDMKMGIDDLQHAMALIVAIVCFVLQYVETNGVEVCGEVRTVFSEMPSVLTMIAQGRKKYLRVEPLVYKGVSNHDKGGACFFSLFQLITVMLQESKTARTHSRASNALWKSGELFGKTPTEYSDVTHGRRFRNSPEICGKASAAEARDFRGVVHAWTDEFTPVDGLGTVAAHRKYGVVLGSLLNLPLSIRHHFDYILLICIYQAMYAKAHGGLVRMLTGVDADGKRHPDGLTLAAEVELGGTTGTWIELPNDDDEMATEPEHWRLRIFILLISLDWLAAGDFGPFAASVSARYPCGKCMWTGACACAYKPSSASVQHSAHCQACAPRTHDAVMQTVQELRAFRGTKAARSALQTSTGIMSTHFASEYLLRNVVKDSTLDIMHIYFCGMGRYMLSWLTDVYCPEVFTFDEMNARKRAHNFGAGVRVPDLEPAKGSNRGSCTIKLNGAQTMHFALARWSKVAELHVLS